MCMHVCLDLFVGLLIARIMLCVAAGAVRAYAFVIGILAHVTCHYDTLDVAGVMQLWVRARAHGHAIEHCCVGHA